MLRSLGLSTLALTGVVSAFNGSVTDYAPLVNQPCPNITTDPLLRAFTPQNQSLHPREEEYVATRQTTVIPNASYPTRGETGSETVPPSPTTSLPSSTLVVATPPPPMQPRISPSLASPLAAAGIALLSMERACSLRSTRETTRPRRREPGVYCRSCPICRGSQVRLHFSKRRKNRGEIFAFFVQ